MVYLTSKDFPVKRRVLRVQFKPLSEFYVPSPLDSFMYETYEQADGKVVHHLTRDVGILLNQKRISGNALETAVNHILSQVRVGSLSDQFSHLSDDALLSCIKSRYIQSPSELLSWSEYLQTQIAQMEAADRAAMQQRQQQQQQQQPQEPPASE